MGDYKTRQKRGKKRLAVLVLNVMEKIDIENRENEKEEVELSERYLERFGNLSRQEFANYVIQNPGDARAFYYFQRIAKQNFRTDVRAFLRESNRIRTENSWYFRLN